MAKRFVKTSLATKLRILFGAAVLGIIATALVVPWYFMEVLAKQGAQRPALELARLRLNEWLRDHPKDPRSDSQVASLYTFGAQMEARKGPVLHRIRADRTAEPALDSAGIDALEALRRDRGQELAILEAEDERGKPIFRCFRPVRAGKLCLGCHGPTAKVELRYETGQLVGIIDLTLPGSTASGTQVWGTRIAFVVGVVLAGLVAFILFAVITQRLILHPVRRLRDLTDKVAEGDLAVRSTIRTGDELQRLGEGFNDMLSAINEQHERLRAANRALDLKLNELAEANVTLFRANQVKNEFLANVSHELRTPLNSIIGFADLVAGAPDEKLRRYGQNIQSAAKSLLTMINDLLDLAKIEAGRADVRFDKVSVSDTCQTLAALMKPLADKKELDLRVELAPDLPIIVTDAGKCQQILYNLLSNAIKFTPAGGRVTVSAGLESAHREGRTLQEVAVSVADTGPGISEAQQQHIFEKFYQGDRSLTKESSGAGLGLSISRELAGLLRGRLSLKSTPGHGATFTIALPVDPTEADKPSAPPQGGQAPAPQDA